MKCFLDHIYLMFVLVVITSGEFCAAPSPPLPRRNFDVLDTLARQVSQQLAAKVREASLASRVSPHDTLRFFFAPHPAAWLVEQYIIPDLAPMPFRRARAADTVLTRTSTLLNLRVADCGVRYFTCDHAEDSLTREAHIILVASIEAASGIIIPLQNTALDYRDTVARRTVPALESRQYEFANGSVPEPQKTFWKTVVEPAIVVAAIVITVVLLFTVRTQ